MLEKYKLKANDAILTEEEAIFKDIQDNYKVSKNIIIDNYNASSSWTNTMFAITSLRTTTR